MTNGDDPMQSAIFLARDLDAFGLIMATAGSSCSQTNLAVTVSRDRAGVLAVARPGLFSYPNRAAPQFKCELRDTKHRQIDAATQRQILAPMARILAPSQRVFFKGIVCDFQEVEDLKQAMSPTLNCFPAFQWAFFEALSLAKTVADAAVPHDDIRFMMRLYFHIALTLATFTYTDADNRMMQRRNFRITCPETVEGCDILGLEALVNTACCAVKMGDYSILREAGDRVQAAMKRIAAENGSLKNIPPQLRRLCYSAMMWKNLYCGTNGYQATVREVVEYLAGSERHPHLAHDSEILLRQPDQEAVATREHLQFNQWRAF